MKTEALMSAKRSFLIALLFFFWLGAFGLLIRRTSAQTNSAASKSGPPVAPVRPITDDYFGTKVVDPYRYMENLKDPEVQSWIKAQSDYTNATLAAIAGRAALLARIKQLDQSVPQVTAVPLPGDAYLIQKRLPTEDVAKLYFRQGLTGSDKLLVDPEKVKLSPENAGKGRNAIAYFQPSLDAKYVAVGIGPGGSEADTELHIFEIASGRDTGDVIYRAWGASPAWLPGDHALVYGKLQKLDAGAPATDKEKKFAAYIHVLASGDSEKDPRIFGYDAVPSIKIEPSYWPQVAALPASNYAIAGVSDGADPNNEYYVEPVSDLAEKNAAWQKFAAFSDDVNDVEVHGDDLYLLSFKNALRYKVLRTDARKPDLATAETIVPPSQSVVTNINPAQDGLYVQLLDGGINRLLRVTYGPHPQTEEIALPVTGSIELITDPRVPGALIELTSWTSAATIYRYDPASKRVTDTKLQPKGPYDDPPNIEAEEIKVPSYDGVQVPLSIVHRKNMPLDGSNPTLMYGYGAYAISTLPFYDPTALAWYEKGGILAICHARGGGEYGEQWHLAGKLATKPNTWRDFIACGQYLVDHKYTSPSHLAGTGGSAGGILIGRAFTERPDLFAAAIDEVGCSDTLRMETTANGVPNIPEFGSTKTEDGFKALSEMSSYDHIKPKTPYPAVMFETGINDPRVDPWHMAKMTAILQASTSSGKAVLLRVEYAGGHGGIGGTAAQRQLRDADNWSFLLWQFGVAGFQPTKK
jgi:prolyl oligopeptidase